MKRVCSIGLVGLASPSLPQTLARYTLPSQLGLLPPPPPPPRASTLCSQQTMTSPDHHPNDRLNLPVRQGGPGFEARFIDDIVGSKATGLRLRLDDNVGSKHLTRRGDRCQVVQMLSILLSKPNHTVPNHSTQDLFVLHDCIS